MGSGSTRKITDRPIIRVPQTGTGSGGAGKEEVADICKPSFDVILNNNCKDDLIATISVNFLDVIVEGKVVGQLPSNMSKMVAYCQEQGIVYVGKIISSDKQQYARFKRSDT